MKYKHYGWMQTFPDINPQSNSIYLTFNSVYLGLY